MAPVIANNLPYITRYNQPLDFNKTFRGKRIFGEHKTIRGILAGIVMGGIVGAIQLLLARNYSLFDTYSLFVDYRSAIVIVMGMSMGFGAVAGDAVESFFKRQIGIAPGKSWVPFDQLDFVIGGMLTSLPFLSLPLDKYLLGVIIALVLHPTFNILAWLLRLQEKPY